MDDANRTTDGVTLLLQTAEGQDWPLYLSVDCVRFIGAYRRVENFGPGEGLLQFRPGKLA